jgi:hypothetical protein
MNTLFLRYLELSIITLSHTSGMYILPVKMKHLPVEKF